MSLSLYTLTVGTYLQILPQIAGLVEKAEEHCRANGLDAEALTGARLADDMWPFAKQVFECGHHSARALEGLRAGVFGPEIDPAPLDFASLHKEIGDAIAQVQAAKPAEIDALAGRDMRFEFGPRRMDFTVEDFVLSFSLPNFYFHATTAFDILRNQKLPIGKLDYLGKPRLKTPA
jgi:hypothetical protein